MGLDVSVYTDVEICCEEDVCFEAYVIDDRWEHKIKNLLRSACYKGDIVPDVEVRYSYSTHGEFREYLVKLTGSNHLLDENGKIIWAEIPAKIPFIDLIDFADNEGCLDWETAKRLLIDFNKYQSKNEDSNNEYMKSKYKDWHNVVKAASNKGVIVFH